LAIGFPDFFPLWQVIKFKEGGFVKSRFDLDSYQPVSVVNQLRASILQKIKKGEEILPDIQGREETKKDVLRALLSGYNIYLVSEEGTGKTRLAKSLTKLLSPIPRIKNCPYNDDPKWPNHLLCPRCSEDPVREYELVAGERRFSRIQGNDYTDEGKLLGLVDIQAIAQGRSPTDAMAFAATGIFRANRGILFIDELPAIRTKVQVLLHPVLEEKKAILEEYNWEHPLDIVLVATGNPQGFSHVNEVPRPLLDRLELIYMPLPTKDIEMEIMLREKFKTKEYSLDVEKGEDCFPHGINMADIERKVSLPWWIIYLLNESMSHSRKCGLLEKTASLRGSYRALDHTYAGAELENRNIAYLQDVVAGLKLALRGRIELKPDLIDFENPGESFKRTDEVSEDLLWNAFENLTPSLLADCDREKLARDIRLICSSEIIDLTCKLQDYGELNRVIRKMEMMGKEKVKGELLNDREREIFMDPEAADRETLEQYNYSAFEVVLNAALHSKLIAAEEIKGRVFIPEMVTWAKGRR
ncbi:MAG: ATP-binding protein, partial [Syntrophales bacterium]|nr:ATP-binding protein [Syntrophales bacterium]